MYLDQMAGLRNDFLAFAACHVNEIRIPLVSVSYLCFTSHYIQINTFVHFHRVRLIVIKFLNDFPARNLLVRGVISLISSFRKVLDASWRKSRRRSLV